MKDKNLISLKDVNRTLKKRSLKNSSYSINPFIWKVFHLPVPEREYRFHPVRRWRFDYAFTEKKIAIEIEGGLYTNGRHTRIKGFQGDIEKYNTAVEFGWILLRYLPNKINFEQIFRIYNKRIDKIEK